MTARAVRGGWLRRLEVASRPDDPEVTAAYAARWEELPDGVRTPAQMLGRKLTGCEGTHGVFPACDFGCEPCYHGKEANRVPVDGTHTVAEVERQMAYLRRRRGPGQYAQLIGGEVSLLPPDAHAGALAVMRDHGRIPMSFTHGDFDDDYLEAVVLAADGTPRFPSVSFAVHVDSTMRGRRAVKQPTSEAQLHQERARIAAMFARLRARHGIDSYLAHNMTVTPDNVHEIPDVVRVCRQLGYRMCSFQPAAYVGDERRWAQGYGDVTDEALWQQVERGVGARLPFRALQVGDERCNRSTWGLWVGQRYVALFDDLDGRDLRARDAYFRAVPANLRLGRWPVMLARTLRSMAGHPADVVTLARWGLRFVRRAIGGLRGVAAARGGPRLLPTTYVMHRFMDAGHVRQAWELMERGVAADEPDIRATQERLQACAYGMAHPDTDRVVPACVQHSVLDTRESQQLLQLLPPRPARRVDEATAGGPSAAIARRGAGSDWTAWTLEAGSGVVGCAVGVIARLEIVMSTDQAPTVLDRRQFLRGVSRSTLGLAFAGTAGTLLAACAREDPTVDAGAGTGLATSSPAVSPTTGPPEEARAIVGDVVDFALTSDDWEGDFGFVTMRLHAAVVDDADAYFVRTDSSDEEHAEQEQLVFVPRLRALVEAGLVGTSYVFGEAGDDQPVVLSTEPGRDDYTPAFELHRVAWEADPRVLRSAAEVEAAADAGELAIEATGIVVNAPLVVWSTGRLPSDDELVEYLGPGQLVGEPDLDSLEVTFKLHECFPGSRYIVTDTSAPPMAEGMHVGAAPRLQEATAADATGRVNVFMGGVEGPGPMGFQPSVFDSRAGDPVWSPYWDHLTYVWNEDADGRVLEDEAAVHAARDDGEVEEFVGTPETDGKGFVVNCPVPVVAPNTFQA